MDVMQMALSLSPSEPVRDVRRWYRGLGGLIGNAAGPIEDETADALWITVLDPGATKYEIGQFLGGKREQWEEIEPCESM